MEVCRWESRPMKANFTHMTSQSRSSLARAVQWAPADSTAPACIHPFSSLTSPAGVLADGGAGAAAVVSYQFGVVSHRTFNRWNLELIAIRSVSDVGASVRAIYRSFQDSLESGKLPRLQSFGAKKKEIIQVVKIQVYSDEPSVKQVR